MTSERNGRHSLANGRDEARRPSWCKAKRTNGIDKHEDSLHDMMISFVFRLLSPMHDGSASRVSLSDRVAPFKISAIACDVLAAHT